MGPAVMACPVYWMAIHTHTCDLAFCSFWIKIQYKLKYDYGISGWMLKIKFCRRSCTYCIWVGVTFLFTSSQCCTLHVLPTLSAPVGGYSECIHACYNSNRVTVEHMFKIYIKYLMTSACIKTSSHMILIMQFVTVHNWVYDAIKLINLFYPYIFVNFTL